MRICITGVAGFVGSNLADRLIAEGHEVWGFDTFETGKRENLHPDLDFFEGHIAGSAWWEPPDTTDLIIHCAASYKDPDAWRDDSEVNVVGAIQVGKQAQTWDARIFYFQTVLPPISSYAISKIAGEHYLRLSGQPLTVFRLASIYGPRNISGAIPTFYRQIKAGLPCTVVEDATRDFVFIDDLVERVLECIQSEDVPGYTGSYSYKIERVFTGSFDIRTGTETAIRMIPQLIGDALGIEPEIKLIPRPAHDVPHYDMKGTPRIGTPFTEGLAKAIEWYEANGVGETYTHLGVLSG